MVNHWLKHRLVGGFNQKNMRSSMGRMTSHFYEMEHTPFMVQTTNQQWKAIGTLCQVWQDEGNPIRLT